MNYIGSLNLSVIDDFLNLKSKLQNPNSDEVKSLLDNFIKIFNNILFTIINTERNENIEISDNTIADSVIPFLNKVINLIGELQLNDNTLNQRVTYINDLIRDFNAERPNDSNNPNDSNTPSDSKNPNDSNTPSDSKNPNDSNTHSDSNTPSRSREPSDSNRSREPSDSNTPNEVVHLMKGMYKLQNSNMINEDEYINELLRILRVLNKGDVTPEEKGEIRIILEEIDNVIINVKEPIKDKSKLNIIVNLLIENKNLLDNSGSNENDLEELKTVLGSGSTGNYTTTKYSYIAQIKPMEQVIFFHQ